MSGGGEAADCVILAAGSSTRMGRPKLHLPFGSSTVLGEAVAGALAAGGRVIVVGRADDGELDAYAGERVLVARNPDPSRGMVSTLVAGLEFVVTSRFFFMPGDMPLVRRETWLGLLCTDHDGPVIPTLGNRRGHPVLMPSFMIPAIRDLPATLPLKTLINAAAPLFEETGDEGILADIDDPAAYAAALAASSPGRATRR